MHPLDSSIISALSALFGSLIGGASTFATAWVSQKSQNRRESINAEIRRREQVYTEFIDECSNLWIDSILHPLDNPAQLIKAYAILHRIRLTSSDEVVDIADSTFKYIVEQYYQPTVTKEELHEMYVSHKIVKPLQKFSEVCRHDLSLLGR